MKGLKLCNKKEVVLLLMMFSVVSFMGCGKQEQATYSDAIQEVSPDVSAVSSESNAPETEAEPSVTDIEKSEQDQAFSYKTISNLEFWFGSGAGGWCTVLTIHEDGSFEGQYHDSDMGDTGEDYPNGTLYLCDFKGKFSEPIKIDEYTYSTKLVTIELEKQPDTEEIQDGIRYLYSEPYGLEDAEDFLIYLPGISLLSLPENYRNWVGYMELSETTDKTLPFYGLYNVKPQYGFSSYEQVATNGIDDQLTMIEQEASVLENRLQDSAITQNEMTELSMQIYQLWDNELNRIWGQLKAVLDEATMDTLTKEEREWISYKENEIKKAGQSYEGGSMQPMVENERATELTKERVYELAKYLK